MATGDIEVRSTTREPPITETEPERIKLPKLDDFRRAIPKHCFERSIVTSTYYLIRDYSTLAFLFYTVGYFEMFGVAGYMFWNFLMGIFGFALFVVGHDCLHAAYSGNQMIDDIFGHIAFAPLFTPYFPWQKSHRLHHAFTNHVDKDHGHAWIQDKDYLNWPFYKQVFLPLPLNGWLKWFPFYTFFGVADGSHFWPYSTLFVRNSERIQCVFSVSMCCLAAYIALLISGSYHNWLWYYWVPVFWFGLILIIVTYMQHTEDIVEVFEDDEWSYVRGQTQTVDRYYGFGVDWALHNITDAHVVHHFFNKIPHYHTLEATEGIKKVLEPYKDTPYNYKYRVTYDFLPRYFWYCIKLNYLVHKAKGILQFHTTVEEAKKVK